MEEERLNQALGLLVQAKGRGIKIFFEQEKLMIGFSKRMPVDSPFLSELRANKENLAFFLKNYIQPGIVDLEQLIIPHSQLIYNGKTYYEISPYQRYWIDDKNQEFKNKLHIWIGYRITGDFDPVCFRKAVAYLMQRHESLRSSFLTVGDKYYITVEEASARYEAAFTDRRGVDEDGETERSFYFEDQTFDVQLGPLILVRIIRTGEEEYLVSLKIHHAIFDGWSIEILMRDLLTAYRVFIEGQTPLLPSLKFQYKEWLNFKRRLIQGNHGWQREYWRSLYNGLPGEMSIPGENRQVVTRPCRNGEKVSCYMSMKARTDLQNLATKHNTTLFIVLQASFLLYLYKLTGQHDILIGTMLYGRDGLAALEDQIGFYSYTDLIRAVFDRADTLDEATEKLKKSNEDLTQFCDYTLLMALSDMVDSPEAQFWKINMEFEDAAGFAVKTPVIPASSPGGIELHVLKDRNAKMVTNMDIKIKFENQREKLEIRVLYDLERYSLPVISNLINGYLHFLEVNEIYARLPAQPTDG